MSGQRHLLGRALIGLSGSLLIWSAAADPADQPWQVRTTAISLFLDAKSDVLDLDVDDQFDLALDVTYFFTPSLAVNVLATTTNLEVESSVVGGSLGSVDLLPPIVTAQYHFAPDAPIRPYAGIGFNYNVFSNESGQLNTLAVKVDDAFGGVAEIGADNPVGDHVFINGNFKYLILETDVDVGADPTLNDELDVDAFIVGAGLGYRL